MNTVHEIGGILAQANLRKSGLGVDTAVCTVQIRGGYFSVEGGNEIERGGNLFARA